MIDGQARESLHTSDGTSAARVNETGGNRTAKSIQQATGVEIPDMNDVLLRARGEEMLGDIVDGKGEVRIGRRGAGTVEDEQRFSRSTEVEQSRSLVERTREQTVGPRSKESERRAEDRQARRTRATGLAKIPLLKLLPVGRVDQVGILRGELHVAQRRPSNGHPEGTDRLEASQIVDGQVVVHIECKTIERGGVTTRTGALDQQRGSVSDRGGGQLKRPLLFSVEVIRGRGRAGDHRQGILLGRRREAKEANDQMSLVVQQSGGHQRGKEFHEVRRTSPVDGTRLQAIRTLASVEIGERQLVIHQLKALTRWGQDHLVVGLRKERGRERERRVILQEAIGRIPFDQARTKGAVQEIYAEKKKKHVVDRLRCSSVTRGDLPVLPLIEQRQTRSSPRGSPRSEGLLLFRQPLLSPSTSVELSSTGSGVGGLRGQTIVALLNCIEVEAGNLRRHRQS